MHRIEYFIPLLFRLHYALLSVRLYLCPSVAIDNKWKTKLRERSTF